MKHIALLIPALLAAAPAMAQTVDWAPAVKSYDVGKASGTSPVTTGEKAMCAGYWMAWYKEVIGMSAADQRTLPVTLRVIGAKQAAAHWAGEVAPGDGSGATQSEERATAIIAKAKAGDAQPAASLFEMLGVCRI